MVGKPPQMPPGLPITSSPMPHAPPRPQACRQTSAPPRRPLTQSSAPAPDSDVGIIWRLRMTTGRLNRTEPGASDGGTMGYHQATGWHWHVPNFETRKVQRMVQHANTLRKWMKAGQIQDERQLAIVVFTFTIFYMICELKKWRGDYLWFINIYQYLSPIRQFPHRSTINHHRQVLHAPMAPLSRTAARGLRLRRVLFMLRVSMGGETALASKVEPERSWEPFSS